VNMEYVAAVDPAWDGRDDGGWLGLRREPATGLITRPPAPRQAGEMSLFLRIIDAQPLEARVGPMLLREVRGLPHGRVRHGLVKHARDRIRAERRLREVRR